MYVSSKKTKAVEDNCEIVNSKLSKPSDQQTNEQVMSTDSLSTLEEPVTENNITNVVSENVNLSSTSYATETMASSHLTSSTANSEIEAVWEDIMEIIRNLNMNPDNIAIAKDDVNAKLEKTCTLDNNVECMQSVDYIPADGLYGNNETVVEAEEIMSEEGSLGKEIYVSSTSLEEDLNDDTTMDSTTSNASVNETIFDDCTNEKESLDLGRNVEEQSATDISYEKGGILESGYFKLKVSNLFETTISEEVYRNLSGKAVHEALEEVTRGLNKFIAEVLRFVKKDELPSLQQPGINLKDRSGNDVVDEADFVTEISTSPVLSKRCYADDTQQETHIDFDIQSGGTTFENHEERGAEAKYDYDTRYPLRSSQYGDYIYNRYSFGGYYPIFERYVASDMKNQKHKTSKDNVLKSKPAKFRSYWGEPANTEPYSEKFHSQMASELMTKKEKIDQKSKNDGSSLEINTTSASSDSSIKSTKPNLDGSDVKVTLDNFVFFNSPVKSQSTSECSKPLDISHEMNNRFATIPKDDYPLYELGRKFQYVTNTTNKPTFKDDVNAKLEKTCTLDNNVECMQSVDYIPADGLYGNNETVVEAEEIMSEEGSSGKEIYVSSTLLEEDLNDDTTMDSTTSNASVNETIFDDCTNEKESLDLGRNVEEQSATDISYEKGGILESGYFKLKVSNLFETTISEEVYRNLSGKAVHEALEEVTRGLNKFIAEGLRFVKKDELPSLQQPGINLKDRSGNDVVDEADFVTEISTSPVLSKRCYADDTQQETHIDFDIQSGGTTFENHEERGAEAKYDYDTRYPLRSSQYGDYIYNRYSFGGYYPIFERYVASDMKNQKHKTSKDNVLKSKPAKFRSYWGEPANTEPYSEKFHSQMASELMTKKEKIDQKSKNDGSSLEINTTSASSDSSIKSTKPNLDGSDVKVTLDNFVFFNSPVKSQSTSECSKPLDISHEMNNRFATIPKDDYPLYELGRKFQYVTNTTNKPTFKDDVNAKLEKTCTLDNNVECIQSVDYIPADGLYGNNETVVEAEEIMSEEGSSGKEIYVSSTSQEEDLNYDTTMDSTTSNASINETIFDDCTNENNRFATIPKDDYPLYELGRKFQYVTNTTNKPTFSSTKLDYGVLNTLEPNSLVDDDKAYEASKDNSSSSHKNNSIDADNQSPSNNLPQVIQLSLDSQLPTIQIERHPFFSGYWGRWTSDGDIARQTSTNDNTLSTNCNEVYIFSINQMGQPQQNFDDQAVVVLPAYVLRDETTKDFSYIIELYDIFRNIKTFHLMNIYKERPCYIHWCDQKHALLVCSDTQQANRALVIQHPYLKSRSLAQGSPLISLIVCAFNLMPAERSGKRYSLTRKQRKTERDASGEGGPPPPDNGNATL